MTCCDAEDVGQAVHALEGGDDFLDRVHDCESIAELQILPHELLFPHQRDIREDVAETVAGIDEDEADIVITDLKARKLLPELVPCASATAEDNEPVGPPLPPRLRIGDIAEVALPLVHVRGNDELVAVAKLAMIAGNRLLSGTQLFRDDGGQVAAMGKHRGTKCAHDTDGPAAESHADSRIAADLAEIMAATHEVGVIAGTGTAVDGQLPDGGGRTFMWTY